MNDLHTQPIAITDSVPPATTATPATVKLLHEGADFGPYRITGILGEGGMGRVYRALHRELQRPVALKVLRPALASDSEFINRFWREARAAARVLHQHVVALFDAGIVDGQPYMTLEYVPGGDLAKLLERGPLAPAQALELIAQCADGLQALHEAGLVHRDLKPGNVFIDERGRAKLGDLGLARQASGDDRMTMTGQGMGTPAYMSPEQALGHADIDIRSDVHALGATLYALLTGKAPFAGTTPWAVVNAVCHDPAPDPRALRRDCPELAAAVVLRAMAKVPAERHRSPVELAAHCRAVVAAISGVASPATVIDGSFGIPGEQPFRAGRWWWIVAAGAWLAVLLSVLAPLISVNAAATPVTLAQPTGWAVWLGGLLTATAGLWAVLRPLDRLGFGLVLGLASLSVALTAAALLLAMRTWIGGPEWFSTIGGLIAGAAMAGAGLRWRWRRGPNLATRALRAGLTVAIAAALLATVAHLAVADRSANRQRVADEPQGLLPNFTLFGNAPDHSPASSRARTGAATGLAIIVQVAGVLLIPLLASRPNRRPTTFG